MEVLFANCEFARWDEPNDSRAASRLSLSEGEGEGSFTTSSQLSGLNPSPQSSPLATRERRSDPETVCLPRTKNVRGPLR
jgi:hypothetical protein